MKGPVCSHHHYQYDYLWYANFRICKSHDMHFDSSIYSGNSLLKVWVRKSYTLVTGISKSGWVYLCLLLLSVHYLALDNNIYVILNFSQQHAHSFSSLFSCHNLRSYIIESNVPPWTRNSAHHYAYIYIYIYMNAYSRCDSTKIESKWEVLQRQCC